MPEHQKHPILTYEIPTGPRNRGTLRTAVLAGIIQGAVLAFMGGIGAAVAIPLAFMVGGIAARRFGRRGIYMGAIANAVAAELWLVGIMMLTWWEGGLLRREWIECGVIASVAVIALSGFGYLGGELALATSTAPPDAARRAVGHDTT